MDIWWSARLAIMLAVYHTFSVRHLRLRWPRASLVVLSIALGVATWVATGVLNNSLEKSMQIAVTRSGTTPMLIEKRPRGVSQPKTFVP